VTLMQKNLQGSLFGGGKPLLRHPASLLSMYKAGKLNIDDNDHPPVTRSSKINDGYRDMLEGPQHPRHHPLPPTPTG